VTNLWTLETDILQVGLTTGGNTLIITNGGRLGSMSGRVDDMKPATTLLR
jgi:hypothetical protein